MKHYVYRTTVTTLGESFYYFGKHTSKKDNDGYMGSGTMIRSTLKHLDYLKEHDPEFTITNEILCYFDTSLEALEFEQILVLEAKDKYGCYCMNVAEGGIGDSLSYMTDYERKLRSEKLSKSLSGRVIPQDVRDKISSSVKGKTVSNETKRKISEYRKGIVIGEETRIKLSLLNVNRNSLPWNNTKALNENSQRMWSLSDKIYDVWIESGLKYKKLKTECIKRGINIPDSCQLGPMIRWFEKGNNPHDFDLPK